MPFYEYQCTNCDHRLEVLQKIADQPLVYCPECNEAALKKLISAAAFRLKGTGWYETDFKNNDKKQEKKSSPKEADKSADGKGKGDSAKSKSKSEDSGSSTSSGSSGSASANA
jgi:putative FmdB family regulatory protein